MAKPIAFVTHISPEKALATALGDRITADFRKGVEVFVSSDPTILRPGDRWLENLTTKLTSCRVQILLLSPASLQRPWIHFEAGAAWALKRRQIPLCHSGLEPGDLGLPLSQLQAGRLDDPGTLRSLYQDLGEVLEQEPPDVGYEDMARELTRVASDLPKVPMGPAPGIEASAPRPPSTRVVVLDELRRLNLAQARSSAILALDIRKLGAQSGLDADALQNELVDLLAIGYAEPFAATMGQPATDGGARITRDGMRELERLLMATPTSRATFLDDQALGDAMERVERDRRLRGPQGGR